jgi:hypothetical protein
MSGKDHVRIVWFMLVPVSLHQRSPFPIDLVEMEPIWWEAAREERAGKVFTPTRILSQRPTL